MTYTWCQSYRHQWTFPWQGHSTAWKSFQPGFGRLQRVPYKCKKTQVWLTFKITTSNHARHDDNIQCAYLSCWYKIYTPNPHPQTGPKTRSTNWAMIFYWTGLLVGCRKISQILQDFQGQIHVKNQLISWKIHGKFQANFAEKWLVKHGNFLGKFCWKVIRFVLIL